MRLVAWNCCAGPLATKLEALKPLRADIAVIPESPRLEDGAHSAWVGQNPRKGLAIVARPPWHLSRVDVRPVRLPRYVLPVRVSGPESFLLWGIWAHNFGEDRYVRGMHRAIDECHRLLSAEPSVLLGDFNSHSQWDHEHPEHLSHSALVRKIHGLGLLSAYHASRDEPHGRERQPTFFEYRHRDRPYHIDYVFLPKTWRRRLTRVTVGRHRRWSRWSDHMPLTVVISPLADRNPDRLRG